MPGEDFDVPSGLCMPGEDFDCLERTLNTWRGLLWRGQDPMMHEHLLFKENMLEDVTLAFIQFLI